jgi:hypothetical protein
VNVLWQSQAEADSLNECNAQSWFGLKLKSVMIGETSPFQKSEIFGSNGSNSSLLPFNLLLCGNEDLSKDPVMPQK